ncbi:hypothetical protein PR048_032014, partial [Dryococelus australis]
MQKKFGSIPMAETLAVDEQICPTKGRHHLKQFMPSKPHKWGCKLFVIFGSSGSNYKVYFNNYYTSVPLLVFLVNRGIQSLGTVQINRVPNFKLQTEESWKIEHRENIDL